MWPLACSRAKNGQTETWKPALGIHLRAEYSCSKRDKSAQSWVMELFWSLITGGEGLMESPLALLIGCDCDPDRARYGGTRYDAHLTPQRWRGLKEGIQNLQEMLERVESEQGLKPKIIFCVRADLQMKEIYDSAAWPLEEYLPLWRQLSEWGHEIAWHPHLWRWSSTHACWYQETEDPGWIIECLETGFSAFTSVWGRAPVTCHMGWTFHSDISMKTIERLGVKMDFSASPGVFFEGGPGAAGTVFDNRIDWRGTPQKWYRPSQDDYRRPARGDEIELDIVEIPKFTSSAGMLKTAKRLASGARKGGGSLESVFVQIAILPLLYKNVIDERLACEQAEPFFATFFHPDELMHHEPFSAGAFLYSQGHMQKNITRLIEKSRKKGRNVCFVTGSEALEHIRLHR